MSVFKDALHHLFNDEYFNIYDFYDPILVKSSRLALKIMGERDDKEEKKYRPIEWYWFRIRLKEEKEDQNRFRKQQLAKKREKREEVASNKTTYRVKYYDDPKEYMLDYYESRKELPYAQAYYLEHDTIFGFEFKHSHTERLFKKWLAKVF